MEVGSESTSEHLGAHIKEALAHEGRFFPPEGQVIIVTPRAGEQLAVSPALLYAEASVVERYGTSVNFTAEPDNPVAYAAAEIHQESPERIVAWGPNNKSWCPLNLTDYVYSLVPKELVPPFTVNLDDLTQND